MSESTTKSSSSHSASSESTTTTTTFDNKINASQSTSLSSSIKMDSNISVHVWMTIIKIVSINYENHKNLI